ncbi:fimbrial assembly protein [Salinibacterium sp. UTAS2018]|nr:fimbrial assembly protein [Salinibacterium sp. UTAS2018]
MRKSAARSRGRAIFVALVAVGIAILAAAGANVYSLQRGVALENARSLTLSLTTQQGEYNEVRSANQLLSTTQAARLFAYSTEVSLKFLIDQMNSKLSSGMTISGYNFDTANPLQGFAPASSPLDQQSMAAFSLEIGANSVGDIDDWVRKLSSVDGVVQSTLLSTAVEEGGTFSGSVVVLIGDKALLHRFDEVIDGEEAAPEEAEPTPTESPEPDSETSEEESGS